MAAAETPHLPDGADGARPDRRAVLRGISAMGLAAFAVPLIDSKAGAATTAPGTAQLTESPAPKPKPKNKKKKNKKPPAEGKLVKASDTPLGTTDQVPVNGGMLFESDEYVVTQPEAGKFVGFDALCTHEGCPVDVFDTPNTMSCSCHGAQFDAKSGKVKAGPARKPLPKKPIIVEGNNIYKAKPAK